MTDRIDAELNAYMFVHPCWSLQKYIEWWRKLTPSAQDRAWYLLNSMVLHNDFGSMQTYVTMQSMA